MWKDKTLGLKILLMAGCFALYSQISWFLPGPFKFLLTLIVGLFIFNFSLGLLLFFLFAGIGYVFYGVSMLFWIMAQQGNTPAFSLGNILSSLRYLILVFVSIAFIYSIARISFFKIRAMRRGEACDLALQLSPGLAILLSIGFFACGYYFFRNIFILYELFVSINKFDLYGITFSILTISCFILLLRVTIGLKKRIKPTRRAALIMGSSIILYYLLIITIPPYDCIYDRANRGEVCSSRNVQELSLHPRLSSQYESYYDSSYSVWKAAPFFYLIGPSPSRAPLSHNYPLQCAGTVFFPYLIYSACLLVYFNIPRLKEQFKNLS